MRLVGCVTCRAIRRGISDAATAAKRRARHSILKTEKQDTANREKGYEMEEKKKRKHD